MSEDERPSRASRRSRLAAVVFLSVAVFAAVALSPLGGWLLWRYAICWALALVFASSCVALGHVVVHGLAPDGLELGERLVLSFAAGVLAFATLLFLIGIAGSLGPAAFFVLPATILLAAGPRAVRELGPEARRAFASFRAQPRPPTWVLLVTGLGVLGVLLVYAPILNPENVSYDARWYHLAIAEQYAVDGAIRRFPEGLLAATYPQTATLLYTWAFLEPATIFDRVELAAHVEMVLFLATLAGIPCLVRRIEPASSGRAAWAAFFLFPAIFVYDSELACGADHVAALFAIPTWLALLRAWRDLRPRDAALLGVFVSGLVLTKYTALGVTLAPLAAFFGRAIWLAVRSPRQVNLAGSVLAPVVLVTTCATLTTQHWLRNWIFYGDPVYPLLATWFSPHPWTPESAEWLRIFRAIAGIPGVGKIESVTDLALTLVTFSFVPHDWLHFHGRIPVFGSLFTLCTAALPFLSGARRTFGLVLGTYVALVYWALLNPQDRYLQALVPWMTAATVVVLARVWRWGRAGRVAVIAVVSAQAIWGVRTVFLPSHPATRTPPIRGTIDFLSGAQFGPTEAPRWLFAPFPDVGRAVPTGSRVLVHEGDVHVGLGAASVLDWLPHAYGVDYGRARSARGVFELVRSLDVTHVLWQQESRGADSVASDLAFYGFVRRYGTDTKAFGQYTLSRVEEAVPPDVPFGEVVVLVCRPSILAPGVYAFADLTTPPQPDDDPRRYPPPRVPWEAIGPQERVQRVVRAEFAVVENGCTLVPPGTLGSFQSLVRRGAVTLYGRHR